MAQRLLASTADLEAIAVDDDADVPALHGWRREIFGEDALGLKAGRLALAVRDRKPVVIRLDSAAMTPDARGRPRLHRPSRRGGLGPAEARLAGHDEIGRADLLQGVATVLYAGRNPALGTEAWRPEDDLELALARRAAAGHQAFVTPGHAQGLRTFAQAAERDRSGGAGGPLRQQKLELEHALLALLGPRLTRLRLANIFGFETRSGRATFMAAMLAGLARRDEIRFDVSPFVHRDFLPIEFCAPWLAELARHPPGGVLNVGSGVPLAIGRLALWLIEGYGRGRLVIDRPDERDQFVLDTRSLKGLLGRRQERPAGELRRHRSQPTPLTGRSARAWTSTGFKTVDAHRRRPRHWRPRSTTA